MKKLTAFTDGASRGNPGPAGWGAVVAAKADVTELGGAIQKGTNNEAEMEAVIHVLEKAKQEEGEVVVYTDSSYLVNGATSWIYGWQKNGWQTKKDEAVKNQQLWKKIANLQQEIDVTYNHIPGHAGIPANERADDIATTFADGSQPELFDGSRNQYSVSLDPDVQTLAGAPVYISLVDNVVRQHDSWQDCKQRVEGETAKFRKVHTESERSDVLESWGKTPADIGTS